MNSFQSIATSKNTSLAIVAPGIAEALLATAMGLLAAIPAVMAYNKISSETNRYYNSLETFLYDLSNILSRHIHNKIMQYYSKYRGRKKFLSDINVTPFVDVMLVLLIVFMITAPLLQTGVEIELPEVDTPVYQKTKILLSLPLIRTTKLYIKKTNYFRYAK